MPCVRSWHWREASLLVKRVLRTSVLLLIRWSRVAYRSRWDKAKREPYPPGTLKAYMLRPFCYGLAVRLHIHGGVAGECAAKCSFSLYCSR